MQDKFEAAREIVINTGHYISNQFGQVHSDDIEEKSMNQLVSYVDKTAEELLIKGLSGLWPESSFYTEEATVERKLKEYTWIIDPLDGTTNFLHSLPVYSVSVALMHKENVVMGFVYDCDRGDIYAALKGEGAWMNENEIHVSGCKHLSSSLLATGFPYYDFEKIHSYLSVLRDLMKKSHGLRRLGSAALDLAYTACGRFDGFFEYGLSPWDVAAGALIIEEAGGLVTDFNGSKNYIFGKTIIGSTPEIYNEFIQVLKDNNLV